MPTDLPTSAPDYFALFEESPQAMWVYDLETLCFLAVNQAAVEQYGYSREELLAMTIADIRPSEDVPALLADVAAVGSVPSVSGSWRHRRKDGSLIDVEVHSRPLRFAGRRAELVVPLDVTARHRGEEELRRLAAIVESSSEAIIGKTLDGIVTSWNAGAERLYGYAAAEAIGRHVDFLVPEERRDELGESLARLRAGESVAQLITVRVRKDGSRRDVSVRMDPVRDVRGRIVGASSIAHDITDRLLAYRALAQSERHFRSLIENASDVTAVVDPGGTVRYASPSVERVLGSPESDLVGRTLGELVHPEDLPLALEHLEGKRPASAGPRQGDLRLRHHDGGWCVLNIRSTVLPEDAGGPGLVLNARDVTERRELEEQLRQAVKMEAVGRLAAGVAHDFNNILTSVIGYADLALMTAGAEDPLRESLVEIRAAGERAASLTRQLLTFSRKDVTRPEVLDLGAVVGSMSGMLRRVIGEDVTLETLIDPGAGRVRADRGHLEQVLLNLAVNARDAMPGGGRLTIEVTDVELDERYARQHMEVASGPYVMLAVSDTGHGMDAETQRHVFEPFFTTKEAGRGTGLGLATVYGIVKQLGGSIWVYSEPGRGAAFKVYLPRIVEPRQTDARPSSDRLASGEGTILLLEDDDLVCAMVRTTLERCGYRVLVAATAAEVEAVLDRGEAIDLLLSDVVMPGLEPAQIARRVAGRQPAPRVLFMSGYTDDVVLRSGLLAEGAAFLQKPFTPAALSHKVRETLRGERGSAGS